MKTKLATLIALVLSFAAQASVYTLNNLNAAIPDGDLNGYQNTLSVSGLSGGMTDVNVTLNLSGGFNGDYYAYLLHGATTAILLNRVGRGSASGSGYPDAGFGPDAAANSFLFDDQAAHDVHLYRTFAYTLNGGQLTGQWQPDGRLIDPLSPGSAFDAAPRLNQLGAFNGMDANGAWTLFIADVSPGGEGTLLGWGVQITTVPEPSTTLLAAAGLGALVWRYRLHRIGAGGPRR